MPRGVEQPRLVIGERLLAERRQRERALDQQQRQRNHNGERPRVQQREGEPTPTAATTKSWIRPSSVKSPLAEQVVPTRHRSIRASSV